MTSIAELIIALATFISLTVGAYVAIQSLKATSTKVDKIEMKVEKIEDKVIDIDHAVNGVEPGDSTIRENVQDMHDGQFPEKTPPLVQQIVELLKAEAKKTPLLSNGPDKDQGPTT